MSDTGESGSDAESDASLVENSNVEDSDLREFAEILQKTYLKKENIFFLTSKTLLKLKKIVSEQMDDVGDSTDFTDFDFFVQWIKTKMDVGEILSKVYFFHKNVLP